jgi:hypothetical protein
MSELTFWLGQVASGERNAFCGVGCGGETDRTKRLGVHVADGTGRMKLACPECAIRYANDLARFANIAPRPLQVADLMGESQAPQYKLLPVEEPITLPAEECPASEPCDLPSPFLP